MLVEKVPLAPGLPDENMAGPPDLRKLTLDQLYGFCDICLLPCWWLWAVPTCDINDSLEQLFHYGSRPFLPLCLFANGIQVQNSAVTYFNLLIADIATALLKEQVSGLL